MSGSCPDKGPVFRKATGCVDLLVCFAVKEEAKYFFPVSQPMGDGKGEGKLFCQAWITGMGRTNAAKGIREAIAAFAPQRVITAGFAGGLNPRFHCGDVLYDEDFDAAFGRVLGRLGAVSGRFYCHRRVATTAEEKAQLWKSSGADAVEMESSVIRTICAEQHIPSATVRVISDDAQQDLPLDFNALMTSDERISYLKLAGSLVARPLCIFKLIEFQRQTQAASRRLGEVLNALVCTT
jgi:adenosylhomocysteine nucleosidase